MYLALRSISADISYYHSGKSAIDFRLGHLALNNQLPGAIYPVVIGQEMPEAGGLPARETLGLCMVMQPQASVSYFELLSVLLQRLVVKIDDALLQAVFKVCVGVCVCNFAAG